MHLLYLPMLLSQKIA